MNLAHPAFLVGYNSAVNIQWPYILADKKIE